MVRKKDRHERKGCPNCLCNRIFIFWGWLGPIPHALTGEAANEVKM
jgi:hypothetical protein